MPNQSGRDGARNGCKLRQVKAACIRGRSELVGGQGEAQHVVRLRNGSPIPRERSMGRGWEKRALREKEGAVWSNSEVGGALEFRGMRAHGGTYRHDGDRSPPWCFGCVKFATGPDVRGARCVEVQQPLPTHGVSECGMSGVG
jgi:hypothetical protein